mgnify:CR=1 FL=1
MNHPRIKYEFTKGSKKYTVYDWEGGKVYKYYLAKGYKLKKE